jgi:hypothetical protein
MKVEKYLIYILAAALILVALFMLLGDKYAHAWQCESECEYPTPTVEITPSPTPEVTPEVTSQPTDQPSGNGGDHSTQNTNCADIASLTEAQAQGDCGVSKITPTPRPSIGPIVSSVVVIASPIPKQSLKKFPSSGFSWF